MTWRLPLFSALLMQRSASASEFIRTMVAVGTFYLQNPSGGKSKLFSTVNSSYTSLILSYYFSPSREDVVPDHAWTSD